MTSIDYLCSTQKIYEEREESFGSNVISNEQLLGECKQNSMEEIIKKKRWTWISHVLRKEPNCDTRTALHWTPEGRRAGEAEDNMLQHGGGSDESPSSYLGNNPETGSRQTRVEVIC